MLTLTQDEIDRAVLVLVVGDDNVYRWSSTSEASQVAANLHKIADAIAEETDTHVEKVLSDEMTPAEMDDLIDGEG